MEPNATSAVERLAQAGLRRTKALSCLLGLFEESCAELFSRPQIDDYLRLHGVQINRVTLYRLLDRLVAADVLACVPDHGRVPRYGLTSGKVEQPAGQLVPHFECEGISAKGPGIAVRVDYPGSRIVKGVA
jgi:Fur family transcriptional regulator, ferric uptake regulator